MCDISLILHDANYQKLLATTSHRNINVKNHEKGIQILSESLGCVYWISFLFSITKVKIWNFFWNNSFASYILYILYILYLDALKSIAVWWAKSIFVNAYYFIALSDLTKFKEPKPDFSNNLISSRTVFKRIILFSFFASNHS